MADSHKHNNNNNIRRLFQSASTNFISLLTTIKTNSSSSSSPPQFTPLSISTSSSICVPLLFSDSPPSPLTFSSSVTPSPEQSDNSTSAINSGVSSSRGRMFPSTLRVNSNLDGGGGPAFVGQVFSMCDLSGTGLMAVSTHIDVPFLTKRAPGWVKKIFSTFTGNENNGPMFRFFMDIGDAVSYVKWMNIPTGVVGTVRLDLAYEHFKEKSHMFQFVPSEKQVKSANKLLKRISQNSGIRKVDGVPVFTAENMDIAIATSNGIKWYTPYFFDKNMLDSILEESVDQHFHTMIQSRRVQRRRDVIDDNFSAEVAEENWENQWEPPEVQDVLDEMGHPAIPFSVISKAAEMQLLYAVDKTLLGNRWLRKATGIQPKFPYMVDSFEKRSAASFLKAAKSTSIVANSEASCDGNRQEYQHSSSDLRLEESAQVGQVQHTNFKNLRFPFGDWFSNPWPKQQETPDDQIRLQSSREECIKQLSLSPLLPKITMVGISTGDPGQMSRAGLKKTMEDLTQQLEQTGQSSESSSDELRKDRDPLFVANVGDYRPSMTKRGSSRWVRGAGNR
ncbi:hypothetical protein GIB67_037152 [Kingdonia uniflora]|uniref:Tic22-like family protein n=1 Tax=Kingdonia uniflora TaxID=39325 RepID=A0A7J7MRK9_9MAGN|nr:hypothetical protein GIB67_037152 [Kingdonia uniflora]